MIAFVWANHVPFCLVDSQDPCNFDIKPKKDNFEYEYCLYIHVFKHGSPVVDSIARAQTPSLTN